MGNNKFSSLIKAKAFPLVRFVRFVRWYPIGLTPSE
jgi:hypothetical protein